MKVTLCCYTFITTSIISVTVSCIPPSLQNRMFGLGEIWLFPPKTSTDTRQSLFHCAERQQLTGWTSNLSVSISLIWNLFFHLRQKSTEGIRRPVHTLVFTPGAIVSVVQITDTHSPWIKERKSLGRRAESCPRCSARDGENKSSPPPPVFTHTSSEA